MQNEWRMVECEVQNPVGGLMQLNKELCLGCPFNPVVLVTEVQKRGTEYHEIWSCFSGHDRSHCVVTSTFS